MAFVLAGLAFCLMLGGCSSASQSTMNDYYSHGIALLPGGTSGELRAPVPQMSAVGGKLTGSVGLENISPRSTQVHRLIGLLDYAPVDLYSADGSLLSTVTLRPGERQEIPFVLPDVNDGRHVFTVGTFLSPDPEDEDFRSHSEIMFSSPQVADLIAGDATRTTDPTPATSASAEASPTQGGTGVRLGLVGSTFDRELLSLQSTAGASYDCEIQVSNADDAPKLFALIGLLDYETVKIDRRSLCLLHVPARSQKTVPIRFETPADPGVHELVVLYSIEPYSPQPLTRRLQSSVRTAVAVP